MIEFIVPTELQLKMDKIFEDANTKGYCNVYQVALQALDYGVDFSAVNNYDDVCTALYKKKMEAKA